MKALLLVGALAFLPTKAIAEPASPAEPESAPCQNQSDGRVCCQAAGFKVLVDKLIDARRDRDLCRVDLDVVRAELAAARVAAEYKKPASIRPLVSYSLGVVGTALVFLPFLIPSAEPTLRLGMASVGAVLAGTGLVLSIPLE